MQLPAGPAELDREVSDAITFDAIIVAGGAGRRMGGQDKPGQLLGAVSLLEHVLRASSAARRQIVVAGGELASVQAAQVRRPELVLTQEDPPGGGPVAAVAAGLARSEAPLVLLLAADLPFIAPAVPELLATAARGARPALLVDASGRANPLASAWPRVTLARALTDLGAPDGRAMRHLIEAGSPLIEVPDPQGWGEDCDTPQDLLAAYRRLG